MSPLTVQDGKLLLRDGKLGTEQACCCSSGNGACCLPDGTCEEGLTQQECEACQPTFVCTEYAYPENPEDPCPEGFSPDGFGGCSRQTAVSACAECSGFCQEDTEGTCGTFVPNKTCEQNPCNCCCVDGQPDQTKTTAEECEAAGGTYYENTVCRPNLCDCDSSCLDNCTVAINEVQDDANYLKQTYQQDPTGNPFVTIEWKPDYPGLLSNCVLVWVHDLVSQKNPTATFACNQNNQDLYSYRSWLLYRLFVVDCDNETLRDVTADALVSAPSGVVCQFPACVAANCTGDNPGFLLAMPQLVCP